MANVNDVICISQNYRAISGVEVITEALTRFKVAVRDCNVSFTIRPRVSYVNAIRAANVRCARRKSIENDEKSSRLFARRMKVCLDINSERRRRRRRGEREWERGGEGEGLEENAHALVCTADAYKHRRAIYFHAFSSRDICAVAHNNPGRSTDVATSWANPLRPNDYARASGNV